MNPAKYYNLICPKCTQGFGLLDLTKSMKGWAMTQCPNCHASVKYQWHKNDADWGPIFWCNDE